MKDLANNLIAVQSLAPAVRTADANGTGVAVSYTHLRAHET